MTRFSVLAALLIASLGVAAEPDEPPQKSGHDGAPVELALTPAQQQASMGGWQFGAPSSVPGPTGFQPQPGTRVTSAPGIVSNQQDEGGFWTGQGRPAWTTSQGPATFPPSRGFPSPQAPAVASDQGPATRTSQAQTDDSAPQTVAASPETAAATLGSPAPAATSSQAATPAEPAPTPGDTATTAPSPRQGGAPGVGGMGGIGNIIRDIQGLLSGNPMSLLSLARDLAGIGMPGMGQGGVATQGPFAGQQLQNIPMMTPEQLEQYRRTGQFPQPTPEQMQRWGNARTGGNAPAEATGAPPAASAAPGATQPTSVRTQPMTAAGQPAAPLQTATGPGSEAARRGQLAMGGRGASSEPATAPGTAGTGGDTPTTSTPLSPTEARVPAGVPRPPMRPTQATVNRAGYFQNENNDRMIAQAAWMVNGEVNLNRASTRQQIVQLETAMNRAQGRGQTLRNALRPSFRRGDGGYYDGMSPNGGTYALRNRPTPAQIAAFKQNVWDPVMRGSNLSDIGYGPMTGNASGGVAARQFTRDRTPGYTMPNSESYFRERIWHPLPAIGG